MKGMYGLKHTGILAYTLLCRHLKESGYITIISPTGIWKHTTRETIVCLGVDNFRVEHHRKEDADHLLHTLGHTYSYTVYWKIKLRLNLPLVLQQRVCRHLNVKLRTKYPQKTPPKTKSLSPVLSLPS